MPLVVTMILREPTNLIGGCYFRMVLPAMSIEYSNILSALRPLSDSGIPISHADFSSAKKNSDVSDKFSKASHFAHVMCSNFFFFNKEERLLLSPMSFCLKIENKDSLIPIVYMKATYDHLKQLMRFSLSMG